MLISKKNEKKLESALSCEIKVKINGASPGKGIGL
jgi:hypothetical protein